MNQHAPAIHAQKPRPLAFASFVALALSFTASISSGKPTVTQPVEIVGSVETLDESLNEPYVIQKSGVIGEGGHSASINFDVPAGKRLIIETVSYRASQVGVGDTEFLFAMAVLPNTAHSTLVELPVQQSFGFIGVVFHTGTQAVKVRVDSRDGRPDEIRVSALRSSSAGEATVSASIFGHLVDL